MSDKSIGPEIYSKINSALSDIRRLVGDINFTPEEKDWMKHEFANVWNDYIRTGSLEFKSKNDYLLTAALIVTVAKDSRGDWYGKEFWGRINTALGEYTPYEVQLNKNYSLIGKITDALILKNDVSSGRILFRSGSKNSYVQTFLFQSYAPSQSINAYVRLLWSLFTSELFDYQYIDRTDKELCNRIVDNLARLYSNDPDSESDIEFNGKTYQIRAGLRYGFAQDKITSALLTRRILNYINRAFRLNEDISLDADSDYLSSIVSNNLKTILTPSVRKAAKKNRKTLSVNDIKAIHASYFFDDRCGQNPAVLLCVNGSRLPDEYRGAKKVKLTVSRLLNDGKILKELHSCGEILSSDFIPNFEELSVDITEFFRFPLEGVRLRAILKVDDRVIYDSADAGDDLDRLFLIFKGNKEVRGNCKPDFYTIVSTRTFCPESCLYLKKPYGKICNYAYSFIASEGDRVTFGSQSVFFGVKREDEHYYWGKDISPLDGIRIKTPLGIFPVYNALSSFHIHVENRTDFENIWIEDSGDNDRKQFFPKDMTLDGTHVELSAQSFPQFQPRSLRVLKKQSGREKPDIIHEEKYFIDPDASLREDGTCLFDHGEFLIKWQIWHQHDTLHLREAETPLGDGDEWLGQYNVEEQIAEIPLGNNRWAVLDVPYFRWNFDSETYNDLPLEKKIWFGDIHSGQVINIDSSFQIEGVYVGETKLRTGHKPNSYLLGDAIVGGGCRLGAGQCVYAKAMVNGRNETFRICEITTQPELRIDPRETIDVLEDGHINVVLSDNFTGPEDARFEYEFVDAYTDDSFVISGKFCLESSVLEGQTLPDGEYFMTLKCTFRDPKSLQKVTKCLYSSRYEDNVVVIGNPDKFLYRGVSKLVFEKTRGGNKKWIKFDGYDYIDNIEYLRTGESYPSYKGVYHASKSKGVPVIFDAIKQDKIRMYFVAGGSEGEELVCYSVNDAQQRLVSAEANGQNLFRCLTIYCYIEGE